MKNGSYRQLSWVKPAMVIVDRLARDPAQVAIVDAIRRIGAPRGPSGASPIEEAILLLRAAAEVEHSLLVQYLYSAYSIETDPQRFRGTQPPDAESGFKVVKQWQTTLLRDLAIQEMGHLVTVQNLLRIIQGGTPHLDRENYPADTGLYPFPFRLEPFSREALVKYTTAEMPVLRYLTYQERQIVDLATGAAGTPINHVGVLYARIHFLFQSDDQKVPCFPLDPQLFPPGHVPDSGLDFAGGEPFQSLPDEWYGISNDDLVLPIRSRSDALGAIRRIAEQGEGVVEGDTCLSDLPGVSHFERFKRLFGEFQSLAGPRKWIPARDVPINPKAAKTSRRRGSGAKRREIISHPQTRRVALMQNVRYWALLTKLWHGLNLIRDDGSGTGSTGLAVRSDLLDWAVIEMQITGLICRLLSLLPRYRGGSTELIKRAGAPFELPRNSQSLFPGIGSPAIWDVHRNLIKRFQRLTATPVTLPSDDLQKLLDDILKLCNKLDHDVINALPPPP